MSSKIIVNQESIYKLNDLDPYSLMVANVLVPSTLQKPKMKMQFWIKLFLCEILEIYWEYENKPKQLTEHVIVFNTNLLTTDRKHVYFVLTEDRKLLYGDKSSLYTRIILSQHANEYSY